MWATPVNFHKTAQRKQSPNWANFHPIWSPCSPATQQHAVMLWKNGENAAHPEQRENYI
jgi:hypothetical protein